MDPLHQFQINPLFQIVLGGYDVSFTNSAFFMVVAVAAIYALLVMGMANKSMVPGRLQALAEMFYEFVANLVRDNAGHDAKPYFPFVFSIFMFVLFGNMLGMIPYTFTFTSHIIVTFALSMLVFLTVIIYGFVKNGPKFLKLFVPAGVPGYILPIVTPIEVISFLSRPISLSVRLFGNVLAGHITLKVFTGFMVMMIAGLGAFGWAAAILPLSMAIAITGLEFLVGAVQAYVFAVLTCMYLNDAIHPSH